MKILIRVVRYLLPIAAAEVWKVSKVQLILWVVFVSIALPVPILSARYFSRLQGEINEPWNSLWPVVAAYVLMLVIQRFLDLSDILSSSISRRTIVSFQHLLRSGVHEVLDGASYRDPSTVDKLEAIESAGASALDTLFMSMLEVPIALGGTCAAFGALTIFSLPLAFFVLAQAILEAVGNMVQLRVMNSSWHEVNQESRLLRLNSRLLSEPINFWWIAQFRAGIPLFQSVMNEENRVRVLREQAILKSQAVNLLFDLLLILYKGGLISYLAYQGSRGQISVVELSFTLGITSTARASFGKLTYTLSSMFDEIPVLESILDLVIHGSPLLPWSGSFNADEGPRNLEDSSIPLLEVQSLAFSYPQQLRGNEDIEDADLEEEKRKVLQFEDFSITIRRGEAVAFIGENGGGKSTLLALFARLYEPTAGSIVVSGRAPEQYSKEEYLERVILHTQSYPDFHQSARELIQCLVGKYSPTEDEISQAFETAGATFLFCWKNGLESGLSHRVVGGRSPSGGQRQRIMLALTILRFIVLRRVNPEVELLLLLDEPTSELSPDGGHQLLKALRELRATVIFTTHDHSLLRYADRTVTISGRTTHKNLDMAVKVAR